MGKAKDRERDELRREYDLSNLSGRVRGKHYRAAKRGTNLVLLDPDVAKAFPDASAVNEAPRVLAEVARRQPRRPRRSQKKRA
jgi:hypothetical protein